MGRPRRQVAEKGEVKELGVKEEGVTKVKEVRKGKQPCITSMLGKQRMVLGELKNAEVVRSSRPRGAKTAAKKVVEEEEEEMDEEEETVKEERVKIDVKEEKVEENTVKEEKEEEEEYEEDAEMVGLCEYEKIRLSNIRQREALFKELAIQDAKDEARESSGVQAAPRVARARVKKEKDPEWERTEGDEEDEEEEREPVRKSLRLAGGKVPEIKRFTYEQFEFLDKELKSRRIKPEDFYLDDELVSRNTAVEEREKMLEEMAAKARTFSGKTERPDGLKPVEEDRFRILHVPKRCTIKQFVLSNALEFKCGRGFYEFTKPEIISHKKEVVVVEKSSGDRFSGRDAARLIGAGIPGMRIPPTIFETWQVFVQVTPHQCRATILAYTIHILDFPLHHRQ